MTEVYRAWVSSSESNANEIDKDTAVKAVRWPPAVDAANRAGFSKLGDTAQRVARSGLSDTRLERANEQPVLRWDMMRARHNGKIVYRHMPGLLCIVRGSLHMKALPVAALGRSSFTATFTCDSKGPDDPLPLHDAHLVHADQTTGAQWL